MLYILHTNLVICRNITLLEVQSTYVIEDPHQKQLYQIKTKTACFLHSAYMFLDVRTIHTFCTIQCRQIIFKKKSCLAFLNCISLGYIIRSKTYTCCMEHHQPPQALLHCHNAECLSYQWSATVKLLHGNSLSSFDCPLHAIFTHWKLFFQTRWPAISSTWLSCNYLKTSQRQAGVLLHQNH